MSEAGQPSQQEMLRLLAPYLVQPLVILGALTFGAVVVPLIEEAIKPIGVWLLMGKSLTPGEGFVAGILSGAGYALFENLALSSQIENWTFVVIARIGTTVIHILTTGLTGYALAQAWRDKRYIYLAVTYLTAVTVHGLWNGLTIAAAFASISLEAGLASAPAWLERFGAAALFGLPFLTLGGFIVLLIANFVLRKENLKSRRDNGIDDEQKAANADARNFCEAKLAELNILHQSKLARTLEPEARALLEDEHRRDVQRLTDDRDRRIVKIREGQA